MPSPQNRAKRRIWRLDELLDAVDGISYAVDTDYQILATGPTRWDEFAIADNAPELAGSAILGRNLLEIIQGDDVREVYRRYIDRVIEAGTPIALSMRCDSPGVERELRLTITPLRRAGIVRAVHFQSVALSEFARPPLDLFDFKALTKFFEDQRRLPIVTICSFCQRVKTTDGNWQHADEYYRAGGTSKVRVSHGLCPICDEQHYSALAAGRAVPDRVEP